MNIPPLEDDIRAEICKYYSELLKRRVDYGYAYCKINIESVLNAIKYGLPLFTINPLLWNDTKFISEIIKHCKLHELYNILGLYIGDNMKKDSSCILDILCLEKSLFGIIDATLKNNRDFIYEFLKLS